MFALNPVVAIGLTAVQLRISPCEDGKAAVIGAHLNIVIEKLVKLDGIRALDIACPNGEIVVYVNDVADPSGG